MRPAPALLRVGTAVAAAAACAVAIGACRGAGGPAAPERAAGTAPIRLVLLLAVDQLRPDRLDETLPGGLGRIAREGRRFVESALEHARSETCPGHVSMVTGRHPGPSGIPGNRFIDRERLVSVYCFEDDGPGGVVHGRSGEPDPRQGRSPRNLRVTTLGDWIKAQSPGSLVFSVSAKDRAAVALGGQRPDAAFWLDQQAGGGFTSSHHYLPALPAWVKAWTAAAVLGPVPEQWRHASGDPPNGARADDFEGEVTRWSRTSPHPVKPSGDTFASLGAFKVTPHLDARTLDFARELLTREGLGRDDRVDLLAIGLSGTDYIGHFYGPWSQESHDALQRLDADLGAFLAFVEQRVGREHLLVVLSADHGVLPLPEWLAEREPACPVPGGRVSPAPILAGLAARLDAELGADGGSWLVSEGFTLVFDPARLEAAGASLERASEVAAGFLAAQPGVARVWTREQIASDGDGTARARLYRNNHAPGRDFDLMIEPAAGCLWSPWPEGTSHGSPHLYDRAVPLVFMGPGIAAARVPGRAGVVDIAPTLAARLGVVPPDGLDGRVLPLSD